MSQKPTKPLTPSHSTMKNAVFNFEDIPFNSSSQPISTDSPFPRRDLESRSNSMKINNARKNRSGKLALLLDNSKPSRVSIFTKNNKTPVSSLTSLSPGRRGFKSNKVSDQEKGGRLKEFSSNKSYMRMDSDKEAQFKAILKLNSTDAAMDVYNKETQRPRKHKKGHKLSSGCKDNLLQGQSFNQMSCNMSHLSDTSCFISGLTNIALQNASISQQVPYNSPKHTLLTTVQSQIIDNSSVTPPKVSLKSKKNSSIDKAHLLHSVTAQSGLPYHRKTGAISSNSNEPSVLGKSFSKLEQRRSCVSHASPNNKIRKSTSRDPKTGINKLSELRSKFDAMIGNCDTQIAGALESKNILRNMKQEYEAIIGDLLKGQEKDSTIENKRLRDENTRMKIEIAELKSEQEKLQLVIKNMKDTRGNSPCQSGITTEKRGPNIKSIDSPPLTQSSKLTSSKGDKETERLNQILMRQQGTISTLRKKEAKMMKLIYAIRKQGVNVEKIYDEEVKGKYDQGITTLNKLEMVQVEADDNTTERRDMEKQESIMQDSEVDASVDYDAIDLENNSIMMGKGDAKLNTAMKNKLKLDFTALKKPEGSHNVKNSIGEPVEFHEEFMSKFEEFSLSWRQECMLQKNP